MTQPSFAVVDAFRAQLADVAEPVPRRRLRALAAAAALALAALAAALGLTGGAASPALAVETSSRGVEVQLRDATASPAELTRELRAAGVRAEVLVVAAAPDAVGTWVDVQAPRVLPAGVDPTLHDPFDEAAEQRRAAERLRGVRIDGDVVRIPAGYPHDLVLVAGVEPEHGQPPVYAPSGRSAEPARSPGR